MPKKTKLTVSGLLRLLREARLLCDSPGGRFGEDECGRCASCKLNKIRQTSRALTKKKKE